MVITLKLAGFWHVLINVLSHLVSQSLMSAAFRKDSYCITELKEKKKQCMNIGWLIEVYHTGCQYIVDNLIYSIFAIVKIFILEEKIGDIPPETPKVGGDVIILKNLCSDSKML